MDHAKLLEVLHVSDSSSFEVIQNHYDTNLGGREINKFYLQKWTYYGGRQENQGWKE
jgi:hypothetical protein